MWFSIYDGDVIDNTYFVKIDYDVQIGGSPNERDGGHQCGLYCGLPSPLIRASGDPRFFAHFP